MRSFTHHSGVVVPLDRANVDTDQIIPKQFLKSIRRTGFGANLFDEWRFVSSGESGPAHGERARNPDFVLNQPRYEAASILLARRNFGCGSSREHAPWALEEFGFRALIAPSFGDIFQNNCFKNGLLPIVLPEAEVDVLMGEALAQPGYQLAIDLPQQTVSSPIGRSYRFEIGAFHKECLLHGWDDIGLTMRHAEKIKSFEVERLKRHPWLAKAPA